MTNIPLSSSDDNSLIPFSPEFPQPGTTDSQAQIDIIRCIVYEGELLFVAIDVVMWAKDATYDTARNLFNYYKSTALSDGTQLLRNSKRLKAMASDGKMRLTDFLDSEELLRLVQEIPGKKTSKIKDWLAWVGAIYLEDKSLFEAEDEEDLLTVFSRRPDFKNMKSALMDSYASGAAWMLYYRQFASSDMEAFNMAITHMCSQMRLTPEEIKVFFQKRVPLMLEVLKRHGLINDTSSTSRPQ